VFKLITSPIASCKQRDRILAAEAATFLLAQLAAWLLISKVDFPIERDPAEAWPDFVGWRVNMSRLPTRWLRPRSRARDLVGPAPPAHPADYAVPPAAWPGQLISTPR
jgi:hypothetical protein